VFGFGGREEGIKKRQQGKTQKTDEAKFGRGKKRHARQEGSSRALPSGKPSTSSIMRIKLFY